MDLIVFKTIFSVFFIFLIIHGVLLIILKERQAKAAALFLFLAGLDYGIWNMKNYGLEVILLESFIFSLVVLVYTSYIFEFLYEPPVYSKIAGLLDPKKGKTMEEILKDFDPQVILKMNLEHLENCQQVYKKGHAYFLSPKAKPLFLIGSIKQVIKDLVRVAE